MPELLTLNDSFRPLSQRIVEHGEFTGRPLPQPRLQLTLQGGCESENDPGYYERVTIDGDLAGLDRLLVILQQARGQLAERVAIREVEQQIELVPSLIFGMEVPSNV